MTDAITVAAIIKTAGGANAVVRAANKADLIITRDAVYKWRKTGIPDRYWSILLALTGRTPADIYSANCQARSVAGLTRQDLPLEAAE